jgi:hypothetical protein
VPRVPYERRTSWRKAWFNASRRVDGRTEQSTARRGIHRVSAGVVKFPAAEVISGFRTISRSTSRNVTARASGITPAWRRPDAPSVEIRHQRRPNGLVAGFARSATRMNWTRDILLPARPMSAPSRRTWSALASALLGCGDDGVCALIGCSNVA